MLPIAQQDSVCTWVLDRLSFCSILHGHAWRAFSNAAVLQRHHDHSHPAPQHIDTAMVRITNLTAPPLACTLLMCSSLCGARAGGPRRCVEVHPCHMYSLATFSDISATQSCAVTCWQVLTQMNRLCRGKMTVCRPGPSLWQPKRAARVSMQPFGKPVHCRTPSGRGCKRRVRHVRQAVSQTGFSPALSVLQALIRSSQPLWRRRLSTAMRMRAHNRHTARRLRGPGASL